MRLTQMAVYVWKFCRTDKGCKQLTIHQFNRTLKYILRLDFLYGIRMSSWFNWNSRCRLAWDGKNSVGHKIKLHAAKYNIYMRITDKVTPAQRLCQQSISVYLQQETLHLTSDNGFQS